MADHYRALTRAYRPRTFEDIVAQDHVSSTLRNAVNTGRLAHAYLFCGPRGVGKTTMARVLARVINNVDADIDSEQLASTLNIFEMDAASNNGVDDVRNLRESVRVPPQTGRYKVYIIDEVHMLTKPAWNAFLKTLEEPPAHAIFIFATTEPNKLLPTILSRVQRFDFRRIRVDEIVSRLKNICAKEEIVVDDESLHLIARKADGGLRDALSMMDQAIAFCGTTITYSDLMRALNTIGTDVMFRLMELVSARDAHGGLKYLADLIMQGYDLQEFLVELLEHLRNLFMAKSAASLELIETTEGTRQRYQAQAAGFSEEDILRMMQTVSDAQLRMRDAAQPRLLFELSMLKLLQMPRVDALKTLIAEIEALKAQLGGKPLPVAAVQPAAQPPYEAPKPVSAAPVPAPKPAPAPPPVAAAPEPEETPWDDDRDDEPPTAAEPPKPLESKPVPPPPPAPRPSAMPPAAPAETSVAAPRQAPRPAEPDMFSLFDAPAIRKPEARLGSAPIHTMPGTGSISLEGNLALSAVPQRTVSLTELMTRWDAFCETAEQKLGGSLSLVLRRSRPVELVEKRLTLLCEDVFYEHSLDEHRMDVQALLKTFFQATFSLAFKQAERPNQPEAVEDNYTRFQRMREEDPRIRLLVDLFGAEPEF
jgi:DNA polymerase-3 subunit gamma/tau